MEFSVRYLPMRLMPNERGGVAIVRQFRKLALRPSIRYGRSDFAHDKIPETPQHACLS